MIAEKAAKSSHADVDGAVRRNAGRLRSPMAEDVVESARPGLVSPMRILNRFLGVAALSAITAGCVIQPAGGNWSSQVLLGTTPLGDTYSDFLSARYAGMINDPEAAAAYYRNAWERSPDTADLLDRTTVSLLLAGEAAAAAEIARTADAELLSDAPFAVLSLAADHIHHGNYRRAMRLLEGAELGAMEGISRALRVWLAADRNTEQGLQQLETAERQQASAGTEYCVRGLVLAAAGEDEAALEMFDLGFDACSVTPVLAAAHLHTAFAGDGRERAMGVLARLPGRVADSPEVGAIAQSLLRGEDIGPIRLDTRQGAALGLYIAASAVGAETSGQLGAVFFQMMRRIDPDSDLALALLADSHFSLERYEAASGYAGEIGEDSIYASRARWERARALIALDREDEALGVLRELAAGNLNRNLALRVGDAFRVLEAPREAEAIYTRLIEVEVINEPDWRPLLGRAAAFNELEMWERAEADLLAALEIDPDQPEILNFLGYGWIDQGENVEAGFDLIRRAIAQRPRSGYIVDSLGWAHFRLGQYEDAARELERAAELSPDNPEIISHLGDAYWRTGRRLQAGFEWRRALTLEPGDELAASLEEKLVDGLPETVAGGLAEATPAHQ